MSKGKIEKIKNNQLIGGTDNTDLYPITSTKAVFDENDVSQDYLNKHITGDRIESNTITGDKLADKALTEEKVSDALMDKINSAAHGVTEEFETEVREALEKVVNTVSVNNGTPLEPDTNKNINITVPENLAELNTDEDHRTVTDEEKLTWNGKQNALTFDNVPTANSNNPVKSGGVYQAIQDIDVSSQISGKEDKSNKVTSFSSPTDTQYPSAKLVNDQLATKQGTISDLSTIRSGASAGATAYQKPGTGIPSTDLASAVQTSLGKADTAIQSVTVGTTTTGAAGTNASVTNTGTATEPVLSFTIPQGVQGIQGIQGPQGERGPQGNTGVQVDSVASIIHSIDPTATYAAADVAGADAVQDVLSEVTELGGTFDNYNECINSDRNAFIISDANGNVIAKFDADGFSTTTVKVLNNNTLTDVLSLLSTITTALSNKVDKEGTKVLSDENFTSKYKGLIEDLNSTIYLNNNQDELCITDSAGYIVAKINSNGLAATNLGADGWGGKVLSTYGDSITAINNGDFSAPYSISDSMTWGNRVAAYFNFAKHYGRGIGGQKFAWGTNGGSVAFISADGNYDSRNDNYNYDNYEGHVTVPTGTTPVRGCLCSWLRITTMYPSSIKDTIDCIFVQAHNDYGAADTALSWVANDETDPEWAASTYYSTYGGDYNISSLRGGIASTIMKLQAWMPQAVIVIGTPISGRSDLGAGHLDPAQSSTLYDISQQIKDVAERFSIPCIDVFATDGINGLNRTSYISDTIHPYLADGKKMVARAVIGGLKNILPML